MPYTQSGAGVIAAQMKGEDEKLFADGVWLSIHTASPGWEGSEAAEITTGAYGQARFDLTAILSDMDPETGQVLTEANVEGDPFTADAGLGAYFAFHDGEFGPMRIYEAMTEAEPFDEGSIFQRAAGSIGFNLRFDA